MQQDRKILMFLTASKLGIDGFNRLILLYCKDWVKNNFKYLDGNNRFVNDHKR